ncbi:hypothetical protein GCK72_006931 [Caenorhabditis remanei]|uniref:Uncharacterized protein n=1 Tax=Caenorhabditis remanei TaxID=31234 RepID=A0A6A5HKR1_CAERE|nr:hypothetical protein GCK72_006931 [Caenorhabditis remanei]KAF1766973.1 hypothetical protein GCK72_006931 [Caenorhabditis remanei]
MRFKLLFFLYLLTFPRELGSKSFSQVANDYGTVGNAQKAAKLGSDVYNDPAGTVVNGVKQVARNNVPGADTFITGFEELSEGKFPTEGGKKFVDLAPPGMLPPGFKTGIKAGIGFVGDLLNGESFFKAAGKAIGEFVNPVKLVNNVVNEVVGPIGKAVSGVFSFFGGLFGGLFGGGAPDIPAILDPVVQGKAAFDKVMSGDTAGALETLKNFGGTAEEYKKVVDKFEEAQDAAEKMNKFQNQLADLMPQVEEITEKVTSLVDMDDDDITDQLKNLDLFGDKINAAKDWADKFKAKLPNGLNKLLKDVASAENLLKAGESALGFALPDGLNGFLQDPFGPNGPYGPKGLYGIKGMYGPDGFYGPKSSIGPFGPNGLFGPSGPNGLNGAFGPNGALSPAGLLKNGVQKLAPKLPFLYNPATAKLLENTPFGPKGTHGLNGLFGPNGPYGPFGPFGPNGPFGANGPFGPNSKKGKTPGSEIKELVEKFMNKIDKPDCRTEFQEVIRKYKNKITDLLKTNVPEALKKLFGDKFDKLKKAVDKAKNLIKKLDELKDKIPKIPDPNPVKKVEELLRRIQKHKKRNQNPFHRQKPPKRKVNGTTSTTTQQPQIMPYPQQALQNVRDAVKKIRTCLELPPNPGKDVFTAIKQLPGQFQSVFDPISGMADTMQQMQATPDIPGQLSNMHSIIDKISAVPKGGDFNFLKTDNQFHNAKKFVTGMKMPFDNLQQPPEVVNIFNVVGNSGPAVGSVSNFFNSIKIGGDGCKKKDLKPATEILDDIVDLADNIDEVKKNKDMDKLFKLWEDAKEFGKKMKEYEKAYKEFFDEIQESKPDRQLLKQVKHMEPLLEKSITGIENLKDLNQINELRTEVQTILKSEKVITEVIKYVKDPTQRVVLDIVWKDFRKTARNLTRISRKIKKLETILSEMTEKTVINQTELLESNETIEIKEFLYVYIKAAEMNFTESVDLRSYVESLRNLDNTTRSRRDVREVYESLEKVYEATSSINWNRIHYEFLEMPGVIMQTKGEFQAMKVDEEEDNWWLIYLIIGIICSLACSSCCFLAFLFYKRPIDDEEPPYVCTDPRYSYVQMQDARLEMNHMDSRGRTELYQAVLDKKWYKVRDLIENGALVDATCGPYLRTALFELVLEKDVEHGKELLDAGAFILQPDVSGKYPEQWADANGFMLLFDQYSKENSRQRVITPNLPRPYEILVVNGDYLPRKERKKLPKKIRKKITWGYKPGMDLDKFTHIVIPQKYAKKENTLALTDDDFFIWKCVASLSNIMPESWIDAILRSPTYIEDDHAHMLIHMDYAGNEHEEALLKLKTDLHMGRPKFLTNAKVTILATKDPKETENKKEWEEIIKSFGAEISSKPVADNENTLLPYNSLYPYRKADKKVQNSCWILKYDDSRIENIWKSDPEKYTVAPFRFVLECIARYQILPIDNTVVPLVGSRSAESKSKETLNDDRSDKGVTESKSKETATASKEAASKETASKEIATSKETASRETASKENASKENASKETVSKEMATPSKEPIIRSVRL